jgi:hypothetical protein
MAGPFLFGGSRSRARMPYIGPKTGKSGLPPAIAKRSIEAVWGKITGGSG